jgi:hypothetical protein
MQVKSVNASSFGAILQDRVESVIAEALTAAANPQSAGVG